jgi:hypothetical protein
MLSLQTIYKDLTHKGIWYRTCDQCGKGGMVTETFRKAAAPKHNLSHQNTLFTNKYRATMSGNGFFYKWNYIRTISGIFLR